MEGEMGTTLPSAISPFLLRSATPRSCCSFDYEGFSGGRSGWGRASVTPGSPSPPSIHEARIAGDLFELRRQVALRQIQQMEDKYDECFRCLKSVFSEIDALRSENLQLAETNLRLSILIGDLEAASSPPLAPAPIGSGSGVELGTAPKSISIRSPGYLAAAAAGSGRHRLQLPATSTTTEVSDGEVEVEVYGQGEAKTEMCNNWAKAGTCRYGARCRFAHGLEELRPVIRHPRYKTQPCRMIGPSGDCPYGHRCHFRHSLPPPPPEV